MHNAFKSGVDASDWETSLTLSSAYSLFKDAPARQKDFITATS